MQVAQQPQNDELGTKIASEGQGNFVTVEQSTLSQ
jgi:hypothetical protein